MWRRRGYIDVRTVLKRVINSTARIRWDPDLSFYYGWIGLLLFWIQSCCIIFLDLLFYAGTIMMMTTMTRGDDDCWQLYYHTLDTYKRFNITCQIKRVWLVNVIYCIKCNIPLSTAIFWLCVKNWNMNKPRVSDPKI